MLDEIITDDAPSSDLPDGLDVEPADVPETTSDTQPGDVTEEQEVNDSLSLEELNTALGRKYTTKEGALKSLKDTRTKATKTQDDVKRDLRDSGDFMTKEEFKSEQFFDRNEEYSSNREIISALAAKNNQTNTEVVESDTYKKIAEAQTGFKESNESKSVLESNPKIGQARDKMTDAKDNLKAGNTEAANKNAVEAVIGAFDL